MIIKVLFFAQLKEAFKASERTVEIQQGRTVGECVQSLLKDPGALHLKGLPMCYAVNEDFVDENWQLKDQDSLALLPPVAGG